MMHVFLPGQRLLFDYVNHRGEASKRDVIFKGLDYGENEFYTGPQWFVRCFDIAKGADRSFALGRIDGAKVEVVEFGLVKAVEDLV